MPGTCLRIRRLPAPRPALGPLVLALVTLLPAAGGAQEAAPAERLFYQDFRGWEPDEAVIRFEGPDAHEQVKADPDGLRISLPGKTPRPIATGVAPVQRFQGDCEVTAAYELLRAEPKPGTVAGVTLYVMAHTPAIDSVLLGRFTWPDGKAVYTCQRSMTNAEGKRQHLVKHFPAGATAGRLRFVRRGDRAVLLVAERGEEEFRRLHEFDFRHEDLTLVRVAADNGSSDNVVDVRIRDLEVRGAEPVPPVVIRPRRAPFYAAALVIVLLSGVAGLWVWLYVRLRPARGAAPAEADPSAPPDAEAFLAFDCPRCGKGLKVATAHAGKRVKCPGCGEQTRTSAGAVNPPTS